MFHFVGVQLQPTFGWRHCRAPKTAMITVLDIEYIIDHPTNQVQEQQVIYYEYTAARL